jgi:hypothetical protein
MAENKKLGSLPAVLTYDDVRSVSPALEQYMRGPLLDGKRLTNTPVRQAGSVLKCPDGAS